MGSAVVRWADGSTYEVENTGEYADGVWVPGLSSYYIDGVRVSHEEFTRRAAAEFEAIEVNA